MLSYRNLYSQDERKGTDVYHGDIFAADGGVHHLPGHSAAEDPEGLESSAERGGGDGVL